MYTLTATKPEYIKYIYKYKVMYALLSHIFMVSEVILLSLNY